MVDQEWISTGEAAETLGYNPDAFRRKFDGIIPTRKFKGGYRKWLKIAVEKLAKQATENSTAAA